ncbi:MAG: PLP-dependent transferase [Phycisphaerae bacterium]|nr:PLP-dependent transferase [Phycisphaerae bacterium]
MEEWVTGGVLDPLSCYLLIRGLKTSDLRMERLNGVVMRAFQWRERPPRSDASTNPGYPATGATGSPAAR